MQQRIAQADNLVSQLLLRENSFYRYCELGMRQNSQFDLGQLYQNYDDFTYALGNARSDWIIQTCIKQANIYHRGREGGYGHAREYDIDGALRFMENEAAATAKQFGVPVVTRERARGMFWVHPRGLVVSSYVPGLYLKQYGVSGKKFSSGVCEVAHRLHTAAAVTSRLLTTTA